MNRTNRPTEVSPAASAGSRTDTVVPLTSPDGTSNTPTPIPEKWCITRIEEIKDETGFSFTWTLKNFSLWKGKPGEKLGSSTFSAGRNDEYEWCLVAYPMGHEEKYEHYLSLYLHLVSSKEKNVSVQFGFSILNDERKEFNKMSAEATLQFTAGTAHECGYAQFIKRDSLLDKGFGLLPEDNLTILCLGRVRGVGASRAINITTCSGGSQAEEAHCTLTEDFGSLLESRKFSDVTLLVGDTDLLAHKAILSARSAVFAAMFEHEMEESTRNRVVIADADYEVLGEMLVYMYTGRSPNIDKMPDRLLAVADKYDLPKLKSMCQEILCSTVTVENSVDLLVLADMHCAERLKARVKYFMNLHKKDIIGTPAWKNMIKRPHLLVEVFETLLLNAD